MSDGPRYHIRRGRMPRLVDQVPVPAFGKTRGTEDLLPRFAAGTIADGSTPALVMPSDDELNDLTQPVVERLPARFGGNDVVVEYHGDRVALVLPGMVRILGSAAEASRLADLLARKR